MILNERLLQVLDAIDIELKPEGRLTLEEPLLFLFQRSETVEYEGFSRMTVVAQKDFTDVNDDSLHESIINVIVGNC